MNIYLIGLPGVGKSTVGQKLAEKLNYQFVDLDLYIEQQAMLFIDELFMLYGETYFRALETNCLKEVSSNNHTVIACGGGIVKLKENKKWMKGFTIYLTAPLSQLEQRVEDQEITRPLLQTKTIKDLYLERKDAYEAFSDVEVENINLNETIEIILSILKENK